MDLIRINDLTSQLGLSSRTLRYYEEIGLIESIRPPQEKYRYFDEKAVERLTPVSYTHLAALTFSATVAMLARPCRNRDGSPVLMMVQ